MTCDAIRSGMNVILTRQFFGKLGRYRQLGGIGNLIKRPHLVRRVAMTIHAEAHLHRIFKTCQRHGLHLAVTADTANSFGDMHAVIEVDKIRELCYALPTQWFAAFETLPNWGQHFTLFP